MKQSVKDVLISYNFVIKQSGIFEHKKRKNFPLSIIQILNACKYQSIYYVQKYKTFHKLFDDNLFLRDIVNNLRLKCLFSLRCEAYKKSIIAFTILIDKGKN